MKNQAHAFDIHPSLWLLFKMDSRGAWRKLLRNILTLQGIVVTAIFGGYLYFGMTHRNEFIGDFYSVLSHYGALLIFLVFLSSFGNGLVGRGIHFSKPETQFVLTAPLDRRELLMYQLLKYMRGALVVSTALSVVVSGDAFLHVFTRLFSASLAISALSLAVATACQKLRPGIVKKLRYLHGTLMSAFFAAGFIGGLSVVAGVRNERVVALLDAPQLHLALFPFYRANDLLFRLGTEATLLWAGAASVFAFLCFQTALRHFDLQNDGFHEKSEEMTEKVEKIKKQGITLRRVRTFEFNMPDLPRLDGVGPLLWRRCQELSRHLPYLVGLIVIGLAYNGFLASAIAKKSVITANANSAVGELNFMSVTVGAVIAFLVAAVDFKADTHRMEWLKSLPIKPSRVVIGQTLLSTLYIALFIALTVILNYVLLSGYFPQRHPSRELFGFLLWSIPLATLYTFVANTLFLLVPTYGAQRRSAIGMFQYFVGCTLLGGLIMLVFLVNGTCGALSRYLGGSDIVFFCSSTMVFTLMAAIGFQVVVWAYNRFDVSKVSR